MKTLFLAWQAPESRTWYPVGRLDADDFRKDFVFRYLNGARDAVQDGFRPISAFPNFERRYESSELFPLFQNRVIDQHRRGVNDYLRSLALDDASVFDPMEILSITGGERQTDNFEVFPKLEKNKDSRFVSRFFLHGLRHCTEEAKLRAFALQPSEALQISIELNNPTGPFAVQLTTQDYYFVGWSPRYLVNDLLAAVKQSRDLQARVVRNNPEGTPMNRRILVELSGKFPADYEPMSGVEFGVIDPAMPQ